MNVFRPPAKHAFTLIELLASIAILMIIVSIMGVIFTESDRAWRLGTARTESNMEARAALNSIANDLQYAVADDVLTFILRPSAPNQHNNNADAVISYGFTNSEMCFVALQGEAVALERDPTSPQRATRRIYYWVREALVDEASTDVRPARYELMRTELTTHLDATGSPYMRANLVSYDWYDERDNDYNSYAGRGVVAENVAAVAFYAPDANGNLVRTYQSDVTANKNRLPPFVDIMISVLSDDDAERAADLQRRFPSTSSRYNEVTEFVERNSQRYTTRVYFQNRAGYKVRW